MNNQILLISSIYPPQVGGPAIFISRFSQWLIQQNFQVKVITYSPINDKNNNVIKIKVRPNRIFSFIKFVLEIIRNSDKNTKVLCNGAFVETYIACLITNRKYVAKIPGDPVWEISRNRNWTTEDIENFQVIKLSFIQNSLRYFFNLAFKNARFLVSPSQQLSRFALNWRVNPSKVKTIFNCVNPNDFMYLKSNAIKFDLVTVCRLVPWKGLEELIDVASSLNLKVAIVGNGPLFGKLENQIQNSKANVKLFGDLPNESVADILNQSRIFILNSEYEATSYAIIEAKMCGLPVIARETDGSLTLINDGVDGVIYSPKINKKLGDIISELIKNDQQIQAFGKSARQDALQRFNQDINFRAILDLIEEI